MSKRFSNRVFRVVVLLLGLWLFFDLASHLAAEILWFQEVGYLPAFLLRLKTQLGLWAIAFFTSAGFLCGNLAVANRFKYANKASVAYESKTELGLRWLLPVVLGLSMLVGLILIYYGQSALIFWHPNLKIFNVFPQLTQLEFQNFQQLLQSPVDQVLQLSILLGFSAAIFVNPQFWLSTIALIISIIFGFVLSNYWGTFLQYLHPTNFNSTEPLFERDISFYVFSLPIWELLEFWLIGIFLYGLIAVSLIYLLSGNSFSQGKFPGFSSPQLRHLHAVGGCLGMAIALRYWLNRYELLYSTRGVAYGASYTDVNVQLPVYTGLSLLSVAIAIFLFWQTIFWTKRYKNSKLQLLRASQQHIQPLIYGLGLYLIGAVVATIIIPVTVQRLLVEPNELVRELPYIQRSIALTRQAFDLENIETETFNPQGGLTAADLQENDLTIRNIRLWDTRPLLETNRQLQQIRPYYKFPNADIDRYTLKEARGTPQAEKQQTIIAARELDYTAVPQQAQTWVNEHLVYTHGYGFTLSPVNTVAAGGLPDYFVKDIGVEAQGNDSSLRTSSKKIQASIPIGNPRIYYGEITDTYIMTGTKARELDYPSGNDNVYNTYDGSGGIGIGLSWRRWLFAQYHRDWQFLVTQNFTPQTKVLFRRNIKERVRAIAPFLHYDGDPYLVVADVNPQQQDGNYLYWIIDAYTTSDRYPYSDPGNHEFNYIRNSVKVVVDAYNGSVDFYIADTQDPIINTLKSIFPGLFKPLDTMPAELIKHIRYPVDLFNIQSERLLTYHMTDPQVFYNREDLWQVPNEIYGSKQRQVEPYYLIMNLPTTAQAEEFILLLPFTPRERPNLIAWLAARSDGEKYGKLLLYEFPKQQLIYGTEQIEARINQDPVISQQISLWNRQGSRAVQGNLLIIPIERSLLYVEPLYLESEQSSIPTLVRVIVAYENRIVMAESLQQALDAIFQPDNTVTPAIVRPVE